jgi:hypothetical protein
MPQAAVPSGHGVAVLLKIYVHCVDGQADAANKRITDALGIRDAAHVDAILAALRQDTELLKVLSGIRRDGRDDRGQSGGWRGPGRGH